VCFFFKSCFYSDKKIFTINIETIAVFVLFCFVLLMVLPPTRAHGNAIFELTCV
jgi:hypothetical protein